jgi:hypothetical protein
MALRYDTRRGSYASKSASRRPSRGRQRVVIRRKIVPYGVELPGRPSV